MIEAAKKWVSEGNRSITIGIGTYDNSKHFSIFAYDYNLLTGKHVDSIEEIDIDATKEQKDKEEYERLKAKFE